MVYIRKLNLSNVARRATLIVVSAILALGAFGTTRYVQGRSLSEIEKDLQKVQSEQKKDKARLNALKLEAGSYEEAIDQLSAQINAFQKVINQKEKEANELKKQIVEKEAELEVQRNLLGQNIKAMYLEGEISTIEMLATSKDLSEFLDKQQYRDVVKDKIKDTLDTITALKVELMTKKQEVEKIIKQQKELREASDAQRQEQKRLLGMNSSQQAAFNKDIKKNQDKINELKREQAIENARLFGGGGGSVGGGGYPWGKAPCLHGGHVKGYCYDYEWGYSGSYYNWSTGGYAYRNCTDYVAWRTGAPAGLGNAKTWDDRAPAYGLTVSSRAKVGAAAVSNAGYYGHVMYVEAVNSDGSVLISDYNRAGPGEYGLTWLSASTASNLRYVYF